MSIKSTFNLDLMSIKSTFISCIILRYYYYIIIIIIIIIIINNNMLQYHKTT